MPVMLQIMQNAMKANNRNATIGKLVQSQSLLLVVPLPIKITLHGDDGTFKWNAHQLRLSHFADGLLSTKPTDAVILEPIILNVDN